MCLPLPAAVAATVGAGQAYDLLTQRNQIKAANEARKFNRKAAIVDANEQYAQLGQRSLQERERSAASVEQIEGQARLAASTTAVSAGESGITGRAVEVLLDDFRRQELNAVDQEVRSLSFVEQDLQASARGVERTTGARLFSNRSQDTRIDPFGAALRIGGAALQGYGIAGGFAKE